MVAIRLQQVEKTLGQAAVLRGVDVEFPSGRITALVGPSGSGKTTLLRLIAGLDQPDSGHIQWGEHGACRAAHRRRSVAMLFQQFVLFPHLSVRDNLAFDLKYGRRASRSSTRIADRTEEIAQRLGLAPMLDRYPAELSGGEQQRVALGRTLASEADVVLLDEPLAHLDASRRLALQRTVARWQRDHGKTVVYVTHDGNEALGMADQLAVMKQGRVVETGSPRKLLRHPQCAETARSVGHPPANLVPRIESGQHALYAVRPEHTRLIPTGQPCPAPCWCWPAHVVDTGPMPTGHAYWVAIDQCAMPPGTAAIELLALTSDPTWNVGDEVQVAVDPMHAVRLRDSDRPGVSAEVEPAR